jgi:aspartyl-tRNA(Asn)/glutamyl-tRNA(Gln) amidotransferase subunit A
MLFIFMSLTLTSYLAWVHDHTISPLETVQSYLQKANSNSLNAYITITKDYALERIADSDFVQLPLHGAPVCLKDNILTKWIETTCGSKILQWYIPPYSATCFEKLEQAWWCLIAKANMDEFAMGSSNETSAYGPVLNPYDHTRVSWWSSGGVASAVAWDLCLWWIGTDTWWSIRQPAALCGVVGLKPTYGRVSRYGVMPMANSLDQVGVIAKTVQDSSILLTSISWYDHKDETSIDTKNDSQRSSCFDTKKNLTGIKIAVFNQFFDSWLDNNIAEELKKKILHIQDLWGVVEYIDFPLMSYCLPVYYTLCPAEVSTNLARLDGIKYGLQKDTAQFDTLKNYITAIRSEWFGEEAQRRIMIGSYILNSKHFQEYYIQAIKMRTLISDAMIHIFDTYDAILSPTSPEVARELGRKNNDPIAMYLADIYTILANLVGIPAISIPSWYKQVGDIKLPMAFQLMSNHWKEDILFQMGYRLYDSQIQTKSD